MPRLVLPSARYKGSFLSALAEYHREGRHKKFDRGKLARDFGAIVREFKDRSAGRNLPKGRGPQTTYWLVDGARFIGSVRIRPHLNRELLMRGGHLGYDIRPSERRRGYGTEILRLALPKARAMGLRRVLVTCDSDNAGSRRIIESAGGIPARSAAGGRGKPRILRYWIDLAPRSRFPSPRKQ
jgi:predicted acetyltransferase